MFLLWESRLKSFFQCMDDVFESRVKDWLKEEEWALLVACPMGFSAYAHLRHGTALGAAILTLWAVFPVPVEVPYQGHDNKGACRACLICGDTCLPPSPSELTVFKLENHVELLFASNAIAKERVRELTDRDSQATAAMFGVHANPLSVEDITAIGIQAKHYMRYRSDFAVTWDAAVHAETRVLKDRLLASLDKVGQWSCTREDLLEDLQTFKPTPSNIKSVETAPGSEASLEHEMVSVPRTPEARFARIQLAASEQDDLLEQPAPPSPSITQLFTDAVWTSPVSVPLINYPVETIPASNPGPSGLRVPSLPPMTPTTVESSSNNRATDTEMSLLDEPVDSSVQPADSPMNLDSVYSPIHETEPSPLQETVDSSVQPADPPKKLGEVVTNEPNNDRPIMVDSRIDEGEMQADDNSMAVDTLYAVAETMDARQLDIARQEAGDVIWSQLVFKNIRRTKTRTLKGCKVANRVNIAGWDLIPIKADSACRECKMNGKSCSWVDRVIVIPDSDSDSEQSVFDVLPVNDDEDTTSKISSLKRPGEQSAEEEIRPKKIRKVEVSDRLTRSKTSSTKKPIPSPKAVRFGISSSPTDEPLDKLSEMDGEPLTRRRMMLRRSSNKIPTVTLRRFLPPGNAEVKSASSATPAPSESATSYLPPTMAVEDKLGQADESLRTDLVKEMFERREQAVQGAKEQLCNMNPEQMIEEAA
ncbi:hypothetical protein ARMSODRAFT_982902 [Armillaria solidipes]|uniref:Uncharacterized protein n=1 Tax=Armillaria solidipes TaxID=1076256 RepID=A0A2H3B0U6_9AGAR|nr:hypothetical protein ARMSODRAFT_982902 [Armillaria solidipes]